MPTTIAADKPLAPAFTPAELEQFWRDGFAVVRQFTSRSTVEQMRAATEAGLAGPIEPVEYEADLHYPGAPTSRNEAGGFTIRRLKNAQARHPIFTEWLSDPRLVTRLEQLLQGRVVMPMAHHNCIMTKHPDFSSETRWHQDIRYWSFTRPELVNAWLALGRETIDNGCLLVIPGSHRRSYSREQMDAALFLRDDLPENQPLIQTQQTVELEPGDLLFFHALTFHAAGRNLTRQTKYSAVFTFRRDDNPPLPGTRSSAMPELILPAASGLPQ